MVETNIDKRWEQGLDHHPKSKEIFKAIENNDLKFGEKLPEITTPIVFMLQKLTELV